MSGPSCKQLSNRDTDGHGRRRSCAPAATREAIRVNLAICHPVVVPARGGCETYVADLIRRLDGDGHSVHLYASTWDAAALPARVRIHAIPESSPRFLRPWRFSRACKEAMHGASHDLTIGFDKVAGVDVAYPQGGLHVAAVRQSMLKFR